MLRGTTKLQKACWAAFLLYLIALLYYTIFAESLGRRGAGDGAEARYNLVLFNEILRFWVYRDKLGMRAFVLNVVGNIVAFIPSGFLLPAISRRCRRLPGIVLVGLSISFLIECTQLVFRVGSFDVDDLLLNTIGVILGFFINRFLRRWRWKRQMAKEQRKIKIREIDA